jgi:hypothetical protein
LKKGRESIGDQKGFRTSNRNQKREFRRKDLPLKNVEKETDQDIIARRQEI